MKIVQLDIQGFRSLKNVSWRPGDLNVIIGPNGSGKSNLLRMLELISASARGKLSDYIQSAGGMGAIVWDGQTNAIDFCLETTGVMDYFPEVGLEYKAKIIRQGNTSSYVVEQESLRDIMLHEFAGENTKRRSISSHITRQGKANKIYDSDDYEAERIRSVREGQVSVTELILPTAAGPFNNNTAVVTVQQQLTKWTIYHDARMDRTSAIRQPVVTRLEGQVSSDGQNLVNVLHTLYTGDRKFKQDINDAMFAAFGEDFDELIFPPAADQRIQMRVRWKTLKREQSTADLSDGTLRFLFLMTVLAAPSPPPLIAIDEPETGLHPSMLPIIAEFAIEAATRTQVIFTTHSDQFLDAFRGTQPTTTVAKWADGETTLTTLDGNELDYWLKDYSLGKMFRSGELENMAA